MEAQQKSRLSGWGRILGLAFGVGTQLFFAITVWRLFFFLRDGGLRPPSKWVVVDLILSLQFAIVHSILLLPRVRVAITRSLPAGLYGSLFCTATCAGLWLMFVFWRTSSSVVWQAHGFAAIAMKAGFASSWAALFLSLRLSGFGYQTGWTQWTFWLKHQPLPRRDLVQHGLYRRLRHPVYLSFLGLIWFTPTMTLDHAALTSVWTAYIFAGSWLKDRRLVYYLGDIYREYASRVPGYPGIFFGPLGKWARPANASTANATGTDITLRTAA